MSMSKKKPVFINGDNSFIDISGGKRREFEKQSFYEMENNFKEAMLAPHMKGWYYIHEKGYTTRIMVGTRDEHDSDDGK